MKPEGVSLAAFILGAAVSFMVGYGVAVTRRAFSDYVKTRDGLPGMRAAAWGSLGVVIRTALFGALIVTGFVIAFLHRSDTADHSTRAPASPSPTRR